MNLKKKYCNNMRFDSNDYISFIKSKQTAEKEKEMIIILYNFNDNQKSPEKMPFLNLDL